MIHEAFEIPRSGIFASTARAALQCILEIHLGQRKEVVY